jgi:hypothetical protein
MCISDRSSSSTVDSTLRSPRITFRGRGRREYNRTYISLPIKMSNKLLTLFLLTVPPFRGVNDSYSYILATFHLYIPTPRNKISYSNCAVYRCVSLKKGAAYWYIRFREVYYHKEIKRIHVTSPPSHVKVNRNVMTLSYFQFTFCKKWF